MSQLVVATECPSCGAPLDVSEGASTIRCGSCRSNLLVTGRKQVLSYCVPPKVTAAAARALARASQVTVHVVSAELYFIPYYRLTGHDLGWQAAATPVAPPEDETGRRALVTLFRDDTAEGRALAASIMVGRASTHAPEAGPLQLVDRYVEKSFVARALPELAAYSLGVRAQVLRVGLLRPAALAALGKTVGVGIDVDTAMTRGLQDNAVARIAHRAVLARMLSVIYFPYWVVELERGGESWLALVDGVTETIAQARAPLSLRKSLGVGPSGDLATAGFRPLVCPNCGWDLPVSADDVVFVCSSCEKAWLLHGTEMTEVAHQIAAVAGVDGAVYLPFWRLSDQCVPAFRYRRLKALAMLTTRLSGKPLRYERFTGARPAARGCFYDVDDAMLLARFVAAGGTRAADISGPATLVWLPFKRESGSLVDPFTGMGLQETLLL